MKLINLADFAEINPKVQLAKGQIASFVSMDDVSPTNRDAVPSETRPFSGGARFESGDTLFARITPCLENGKIAKARLAHEDEVASGSTEFVVLRGREGVSDSAFVYYLMRHPDIREMAIGRMEGTSGRQRVPASFFTDCRVPLWTIKDQRAIAEVLGALDDKIAANIKLTSSAAELVTTQFSKTYENADRTFALSGLVSTQYGVTTSAHNEPGPKFLRVTDINKRPWIEWNTTPNCSVSDLELSKYRVSAGDILVARMADPGKAAFIDSGDPEAVFASYLVRLKPHDPAQALYIYYFLRSPRYQEYAGGAMSGSVQKNMNAKVIVATDIDLPGSDLIVEFNEIVTPLRRVIQSHLDENRKLTATRDALLPKLMSGKLRVKDAEKVLESTGV